jgi:two-component system alkaline phosphatase synthesis response regulator PhoP
MVFEGKRILLVDDDPTYRTEISKALAERGFFVYPKKNKAEFMDSLETEFPDIILLDKEIGEEDGFDLIHQVRRHHHLCAIPIIIVTGLATIENKKQATLFGADDVLAKPVDINELELRIIANLRRSQSYQVEESVLSFGDIDVDVRNQTVSIHKQEIQLTRTEYKIFLELLTKRGEIVNREQLAQRFLSLRNSNARTLDVHINSLRKKLGVFSPQLKTIRGRGYMFQPHSPEN